MKLIFIISNYTISLIVVARDGNILCVINHVILQRI